MKLDEIKAKIEATKLEIEQAQVKLADLVNKRFDLEVEYFTELTGVKVGSVIECVDYPGRHLKVANFNWYISGMLRLEVEVIDPFEDVKYITADYKKIELADD